MENNPNQILQNPPSTLGKRSRDSTEGIGAGTVGAGSANGHGPGDSIGSVSVTNGPDTAASSNLYQCGHCNKSYSRVDHLRRHVRVHTQERPYVCSVCGNSFARADLLKRHIAGHDNQGSRQSNKATSKPAVRQVRVTQACEACADLHLKCEDEKPCKRCTSKGIRCSDRTAASSEIADIAPTLLSLAQHPVLDRSSSLFLTGSPANGNNQGPMLYPGSESNTPSRPLSGFDMMVNPQSHDPYSTMGSGPYPSIGSDAYSTMGPPQTRPLPPSAGMSSMPGEGIAALDPISYNTNEEVSPLNENDGNELHEFLRTVMGQDTMANLSHTAAAPGTWTPRDLFEFGMDTNLELNDMDLLFLNDYNQNNPFGLTTPTTDGSSANKSVSSDTPPEPPLGVESLQKASTWRFRPVSKDNRENALSMPATDSLKRFIVDRRVIQEALTYTKRDQILSMIITAGSNSRSSLAFPSVELLDSLLQYYMTATQAPSSLMHVASFKPSQKRPELIAGMIAAGAVMAPDASLRKLGFAIQEAVQVAIPRLVESDNTLTRDLQCLQASLLDLTIGLWSGNSRKMEISESFLQPWATMTRRSGYLSRKYTNIVPLPEENGKELEDKWQLWINEESRKRLVFALFQHDAQASISLFINPIFSYAELTLPLPQSQTLWLAQSAQQWKQLYLSQNRPEGQVPSVVDLLQNVDLLVQARDLFDSTIATRALLCAVWGLIWEYRQQSAITLSAPNQWHSGTLLLSSRLTELKRLLECLRMGSSDTPPISFMLEHLSMHLHMSLEEVHVFAGVEGHEEAKRVYPNLREWVKTPGARQAVWHAGQMVRNAREMPMLRDFNAVAVYQAALAFWCYGVISNSTVFGPETNREYFDGNADGIVLLNDSGNTAAQRFIALNRGKPAIAFGTGDSNTHALLSDPGAVMSALMELLKSTHKTRASRPPLVENLLELMRGLKAAVVGTTGTSSTQ